MFLSSTMMILLQQNKKRREPGERCHARIYQYQATESFFSFLFFFEKEEVQGGET
jgi:hypothetical protein